MMRHLAILTGGISMTLAPQIFFMIVGTAEKVFKVRGQRSRSWRGEMHFYGRGISVHLQLSVRCPYMAEAYLCRCTVIAFTGFVFQSWWYSTYHADISCLARYGAAVGGFNQRQGEALPPQIFLTLKFVICIALKIIEIVAT